MSGFLIGILLFMCVALFVGYRSKCQEFDDLKKSKDDEIKAIVDEKDHACESVEMSKEEILSLKLQLRELQKPTNIEAIQDEVLETGGFVRTRTLRPASPETYRNVFDLDINGKRVIDHLELMFAKKSNYVRGGQDAERESCFRAGQAHVVGFIFNQINKANNPEMYKEKVNDRTNHTTST